jgi:hypothetical protein
MSVDALLAGGPVARIARVGHAPFDEDDPLEITFESGAVFHIEVGFESATDIVIGEGPLLEAAYGHLRKEEPDSFTAIARGWTQEALDLPWLEGKTLANPRRLTMTHPYRVDVGYVFDAGDRQLALFGESDLIFAAALDDPHIESFQLEVSAPYSAA